MNKKVLVHGLMIITIVIATFIVAALTPDKTYANTGRDTVVANIAKVDYDNRTVYAKEKKIADNEIPLAAFPSEAGANMTVGWIIVAASALMSGIVIYEERKDRI